MLYKKVILRFDVYFGGNFDTVFFFKYKGVMYTSLIAHLKPFFKPVFFISIFYAIKEVRALVKIIRGLMATC